MQDLSLNTGKTQFTINGDPNRVIEFNPGDPLLLKRIEQAVKKIEAAYKKYQTAKPTDLIKSISDLDALIRKQIDFIFDSPVSDVVFGNASSFSTSDGIPYYERFINAALPFIEEACKTEKEKSEKRISEYTKKYEN